LNNQEWNRQSCVSRCLHKSRSVRMLCQNTKIPV